MRFGIGGGSRLARGGVSVGKGGVRAGIGSGPFSIKGGFRGGSGIGSGLEGILILATMVILAAALASLFVFMFLVVAVILQIQLASLALRHTDLNSVTSRQSWIWRNRWGILHTYICTGLITSVGLLFWTSSQDKLDECATYVNCKEALSLFHDSVVGAAMSFFIAAIGIVSLVVIFWSAFTRRQDWKMNKDATNEVYLSIGRWCLSIPRAVKERQWSRLVYAPWSEVVNNNVEVNAGVESSQRHGACPDCYELVPEGTTLCPICGTTLSVY